MFTDFYKFLSFGKKYKLCCFPSKFSESQTRNKLRVYPMAEKVLIL